jgi:hypothetical protein
VLQRELDNNHAQAEDALEEPQVADARLTTGRV